MLGWQEWLEWDSLSRYDSRLAQSADALGQRDELRQGVHAIQPLQAGPRGGRGAGGRDVVESYSQVSATTSSEEAMTVGIGPGPEW